MTTTVGDAGAWRGSSHGLAMLRDHGRVDAVKRVVVLSEDEARLVAHVLAVFERVLRLGALDDQQLGLLVPDGVLANFERPDVEMAEVVVEASEPLLRQLM